LGIAVQSLSMSALQQSANNNRHTYKMLSGGIEAVQDSGGVAGVG